MKLFSTNSANVSGQATNIPADDFGDLSQYKELYVIGTGAYGTVYKAVDFKMNEID